MFYQILETVEMADTLDLTTLETAKEELGIAPSDATMDSQLTRWIHEASGAIGAHINRVLAREVVKETFVMQAAGFIGALPLARYPVAFIDSVGGDMTLTTSDYRFDQGKGLLYRKYGRWDGEVVVQYQAGYILLGELPYDIERACLLMLRYRHSYGSRDPMLKSEEVPGVYSASYWIGSIPGANSSLPPDVLDLLAPYKDVPV